ncbi:MAG: PIN domain-containing protein [Deltaproteobacteria bacterium]|nr:PIN domain-containing protein [Deltaproteobacteria bacterium]
MSYLLDTGTLVEILRAAPSPHLVRRLSLVPSAERWTSVISVSQLLLAARKRQKPRLMQNVVRLVAAIRVAAYDLAAAQAFAKFRATVAPGAPTDDVMIAAIAAGHDLTLVTTRPDDFRCYPQLRIEDWTRP